MIVPVATVADGRMEDVYTRRFYDAAQHLRIELRVVTPGWASEKLEKHNTRNRKLSGTWRKLTSAIRRMAWFPNGEAIVFSRTGAILNGQHRLKAIIESGMAVPCLVVYGIDPDAFDSYDQGKKRNAADVLSIEGYQLTNLTASALSWQQVFDAGDIATAGGRSIPNDRVVSLARAYPLIHESVAWASRNQNIYIPPGLLAFLHSQFIVIDPEACADFFLKVIEGVGVVKPSWEFALRRRLTEYVGRRDEPTQIEIAALTIKAWVRRRKDEPIEERTTLIWKTQREPFPEIK